MLRLTSGPALMVEIGLAVFCLMDAVLAPEAAVRWLPRWGWALVLLAFPVCGVILWVAAGRPWRAAVRRQAPEPDGGADPLRHAEGVSPPSPWLVPPTAAVHPAAPRPAAGPTWTPSTAGTFPAAADGGLARQLLDVYAEQERTLRLWEADLRRREAALRDG